MTSPKSPLHEYSVLTLFLMVQRWLNGRQGDLFYGTIFMNAQKLVMTKLLEVQRQFCTDNEWRDQTEG